ncbi:DUF4393 domain-containing protein [Mycobacterium koreense]|uniref:Uncharacterized protein n=1 Tax=Mycolicibacillus koreensis TaxID=1069220 RepID=A0A7I7SGD0_9MYCO|nr:Abi-alpha family protein [Mycolicibacillus koreensis]MCV7248648.1 DUF4393 domain-containing protein [Mycolicibacillus koreensis]OSC33998.1 hypothetical protein B8W67_08360 [Mycolicibacillus koreensis]BBY55610.1 hypothetical protein MKOR_28610 [Mycolicibacillus koreensis]
MDGQDRDRPTAHRSPEPAGDPDLLAHLRDTAAALARIVDDGNRAARNLSGVLDQLGGAAAAPSSSRAARPGSTVDAFTALTDIVGTVVDAAALPSAGLQSAAALASEVPGGAAVGDIVDQVVTTLRGSDARDSAQALRRRGTALIAISYRPDCQRRDLHPAFARILDELVPDEARILRFLAVAGVQPMLDVRTKTLFQIGSELLVDGVSMVAPMAGCRWPDRDQHYFANLGRLGLIDLSPEPVADYRKYALLEVQPRALEATETTKSLTIYRSVGLTAFGRQFVDVCFDTDGYDAGGWDTDGRQDRIRGRRRR